MKKQKGAAEKHLQKKSEETYTASYSKLETFEVKCLTPTKDVNVVYTVKSSVFSVLQLGILILVGHVC